MQGTVKNKREKGLFIEGQDQFITYDRSFKGDKDFNNGDTVEYEVKQNGTFLNILSLKVITKGQQQTSNGNGHKATGSTTREEIARSTAVKAVLGSSAFNVADALETEILKYTKYILTGEF